MQVKCELHGTAIVTECDWCVAEEIDRLKARVDQLEEDILGEQAVSRLRWTENEKLRARVEELEGALRNIAAGLTHDAESERSCTLGDCDCVERFAQKALAPKESGDISTVISTDMSVDKRKEL